MCTCVRACVMARRAGLCGLCCNVAVRGAEMRPAVATAHAWLLFSGLHARPQKGRRESRGHLRGKWGRGRSGWGVNNNGAHLDALKYLMRFCSIFSRMAWSIFSDAFMQNSDGHQFMSGCEMVKMSKPMNMSFLYCGLWMYCCS